MLNRSRAEEYLPLKGEENEDNVHTGHLAELGVAHLSRSGQKQTFVRRIAFYISLSINVILLALLSYTAGVVSRCGSSSSLFEISSMHSPARDVASRNIERQFPHLLDTSLYMQPPSYEVDRAWSDLYNFGISRVSQNEADTLLSAPIPAPGDEGTYVVELDVWHQLHCLNMIRQALHPEYYGDMNTTTYIYDVRGADTGSDTPLERPKVPFSHIGHCINAIRESLMCTADVTPIVYYWDEQIQRSVPVFDTVHVCRDFEGIKKWALERKLEGNFTPL